MNRQLLDAAAMLPAAWRPQADGGPLRAFNPSLVCIDGQLVMAYRVVFARQDYRIAICRLDDTLRVQPETSLPLSDYIENGGMWLKDPRLLFHQGRLWLYYDHLLALGSPANRLVLVELDPTTLLPKGPARPILQTVPRQPVEKNWMLFGYEDDLYAVYRMTPHIIFQLDLTQPDQVMCRPIHQVAWDDQGYTRRYGELRGGSPAVRVGDAYYAFFHSWYSSSAVDRLLRPVAVNAYQWGRQRRSIHALSTTLQATTGLSLVGFTQRRRVALLLRRYRLRFEQRWYVAGFYSFSARPPFEPLGFTFKPILAPQRSDQRLFARSLNQHADRSVFPTGGVLRTDGQWVVSYGMDTERAALCTFDHQTLLSQMLPIGEDDR